MCCYINDTPPPVPVALILVITASPLLPAVVVVMSQLHCSTYFDLN